MAARQHRTYLLVLPPGRSSSLFPIACAVHHELPCPRAKSTSLLIDSGHKSLSDRELSNPTSEWDKLIGRQDVVKSCIPILGVKCTPMSGAGTSRVPRLNVIASICRDSWHPACLVAAGLARHCRVLSAKPIGCATRLVPRGKASNSAYDLTAPAGLTLRGHDPHLPLQVHRYEQTIGERTVGKQTSLAVGG